MGNEIMSRAVVCFDSDGTVLDTMGVKHDRCLAPALIAEWSLEKYADRVTEIWRDINMRELTRGVVRYKALSLSLRRINDTLTPIRGIDALESWTASGGTLNVETLRDMAAAGSDEIFAKALRWTLEVNRLVAEIPVSAKRPFTGAAEGLAATAKVADIAVISTANHDALTEEWGEYGFLPLVKDLMGQERGSKTACIASLIAAGYGKDRIMMVGDAPGDMEAAAENGVCRYPILEGRETESWAEYVAHALPCFLSGDYKSMENDYIKAFYENLGG